MRRSYATICSSVTGRFLSPTPPPVSRALARRGRSGGDPGPGEGPAALFRFPDPRKGGQGGGRLAPHAEHVRGLAFFENLDVDVAPLLAQRRQATLDRLLGGATGE